MTMNHIRVRPYIRIPGCAIQMLAGLVIVSILGILYVIQEAPTLLHDWTHVFFLR